MRSKRKVPVFEAQDVLLQLFDFLKNVDNYDLSSNVLKRKKIFVEMEKEGFCLRNLFIYVLIEIK